MNNLIWNLTNNLIHNSKDLGSEKGLAFQKVESLIYIKVVGVFQRGS